jgi:hypothetical protein
MMLMLMMMMLLLLLMMMMMIMISPFGQLGLWAPSSGVRDVSTSAVNAFTYTRH